jgi:hypothetical protein
MSFNYRHHKSLVNSLPQNLNDFLFVGKFPQATFGEIYATELRDLRFCQRWNAGIPARITSKPSEERTGRTIHRFTVKATAAIKKMIGVQGYPHAR